MTFLPTFLSVPGTWQFIFQYNCTWAFIYEYISTWGGVFSSLTSIFKII